MSRSFKKTPGWCDKNPGAKRKANKRFRRYQGSVQSGNWYKLLYERWDICDWKFLYWSKQEVKRAANKRYSWPEYRYYMK